MENKLDNLPKSMTYTLFMGIILAVVGIFFCAFRAQLVSVLLTVVGVGGIAIGALDLIRRRYAEGGIFIAAGIVIIACGWTIVDITLLILGVFILAYAVCLTICSIPKLKAGEVKDKLLALAYPLLLCAFGILLIVAKWHMVDALFIVVGALMIASGGVITIGAITKKQ